MSLNPLKNAPKESGASVGAAAGLLISYFFKLPAEVSFAAVIVLTFMLGFIMPERKNTDHAQDLSGGEA